MSALADSSARSTNPYQIQINESPSPGETWGFFLRMDESLGLIGVWNYLFGSTSLMNCKMYEDAPRIR